MSGPVIEFKGINKLFGGVHALENVSMDLYAGEVVSVIGHNGAGKSTLMKVVSGALLSDGGEVSMDGKVVIVDSPITAHQLGIEMVFQDLALLDNLNSIDNFFLGREITKNWFGFRINDTRSMRDGATKSIAEINPHFKNVDTEVGLLSGGQRQTISIARAVHDDTKVLILDEPTAALGPAETELVRQLIRRLKAKGLGIFMISHDMQDVINLSDRIVAMRGGQVVGIVASKDAKEDDLLSMIIAGKCPTKAERGPGAMN